MTKRYITYPDGSRCYTGASCRRHQKINQAWIDDSPAINQTKLSQTIAYLLRHSPETAGITLEEKGWTGTETLLKGINLLNRFSRQITTHDLMQIVNTDNKQRYTLKGNKIRAAQGHSTKIDLNLKATTPPQYLYHGTSVSNLEMIQTTGLKPMTRNQIHFSENIETATQVGSRHGTPVIIKILAGKAHEEGIKFYKADNGVWLTDEKVFPTKYFK